MAQNACDTAILLGDLSWGKRASSLYALLVEHLHFAKKENGIIMVEATFHFDKVMDKPHTLTLSPHPVKEKDPVYALIMVRYFFPPFTCRNLSFSCCPLLSDAPSMWRLCR
jgi:hypothetical protein